MVKVGFDCKLVKILLKVTFIIDPTTVAISIISTMITVPRNTTKKTGTKVAITTAAAVQIVVDRAAAAVVKEAARDTAVVQVAAEVEVDRDEAHTNNYSVLFFR